MATTIAHAPPASAQLAIFTEAVEWGGTERVVQAMADRFPAAPIYANHFDSLDPPSEQVLPWVRRARLVPSGGRKRHFLGPLYARRLAETRAGEARVVVTFPSAGWALAAPLPPGGRLVAYMTGPPPPLYGEAHLYLRNEPAPLRPLMLAAVPALRAYYRRLMRRPHRVITVSRARAAALGRVYGRRAQVIHPPVRTGFFTPAPVERSHFLAISRLVPQKRVDVLVRAFAQVDEPLVVVGHGPWMRRLRAVATPNVRFTGWVADDVVRDLVRASRALVCPSVEDFGIVMAEAQACGVPILAPRDGGALDVVDDPATGRLIRGLDADSLAQAVRDFRDDAFDPVACRASAERFAQERFAAQMEQVIAEELATA